MNAENQISGDFYPTDSRTHENSFKKEILETKILTIQPFQPIYSLFKKLLKCNLHTIKFTNFKSIIQYVLVNLQSYATSTKTLFQNISVIQINSFVPS